MHTVNRLFYTSTYLLLARSTIGNIATAFMESPPAQCASSTSSSHGGGMSGSYDSGSSSVAFVTTPDENCAKKLARDLVEQKLAACVNIIPQITSIYMWEGKVNEDGEVLLMIKTRTSRVDDLTKWVRENHPYSVAEVIALPIDKGNLPYLNWIAQTVDDKLQ